MQVEDRVRQERHEQQHGRSRGAPDEQRESANRHGEHDPPERQATPTGPTTAAMIPSAIRRGVGLLRETCRRREMFGGLARERRAVRASPAACDNERDRPGQHANRKRHRAAEQRAGRAAPRALQQHQSQQRQREPDRLRARADGERRQNSAPSTIIGQTPRARPACGAGFSRWRTNAAREAACAASVTAKPRHVAQRPHAVNQNSGLATTTSVARAARRSRAAPSDVRVQRPRCS